jgi:hypothetical protein
LLKQKILLKIEKIKNNLKFYKMGNSFDIRQYHCDKCDSFIRGDENYNSHFCDSPESSNGFISKGKLIPRKHEQCKYCAEVFFENISMYTIHMTNCRDMKYHKKFVHQEDNKLLYGDELILLKQKEIDLEKELNRVRTQIKEFKSPDV